MEAVVRERPWSVEQVVVISSAAAGGLWSAEKAEGGCLLLGSAVRVAMVVVEMAIWVVQVGASLGEALAVVVI